MGAYAPAPIVTSSIMEEVSSKIIAPTLQALHTEGMIILLISEGII